MASDVRYYRLYDKATSEVVKTGLAALDAPFELTEAGLPRHTLHWEIPAEKPKRISAMARYRGRRRRLKKRLEKQVPLFAKAAYESELAARPAYYGLEPQQKTAGSPPARRRPRAARRDADHLSVERHTAERAIAKRRRRRAPEGTRVARRTGPVSLERAIGDGVSANEDCGIHRRSVETRPGKPAPGTSG